MTEASNDLLKKIKVCTDAEAEECSYLVCVQASIPSKFDDDFFGQCCECGVRVRYRWHAPRKPKKICLPCMVKKLDQDGAD